MDRGAWTLELYASFHSTANLELLRVTRAFDLERVAESLHSRSRGGRRPIPILGHGTLYSSDFMVPNVRYAPGTTYNVISARQLASDHGLQTVFEEQRCYIVDRGTRNIVGRGHLLEYNMWGMYQLDYLRIRMAKKKQDHTSNLVQKLAHRMECWTGGALRRQYREERDLFDESIIESFEISRGPADHSAIGREGGSEGLAPEQAASEWVLDCFAGHHITSNLLVMYNLSTDDDDQVYRVHRRIPWRGSVRTACLDIPNVAYVPTYVAAGGAASDVISVAQLASDHGLVTVFEPTGCYIRDPSTAGNKDVGRARLRDGTYVLEYLRIGQDADARLLPTTGEGPGQGLQTCDDNFRVQAEKSTTAPVRERHALSSHSQQPVLARQHSTYTLTEWPDDDKFGLLRFERFSGDGPSKVPVRVGPAFAYSHPVVASEFNRNVYVMDSGASFHMTPDRNRLRSYMCRDDGMFPSHFPAEIYVGDGVRLPVRGIGNIRTGAIRLEDVLHIEGLVANLVSVSQLTHQLTNQLVDHLGKASRQLHPVGVFFRLNGFAINVGQAEVGHGTRMGQVYHLHALQEFPTND